MCLPVFVLLGGLPWRGVLEGAQAQGVGGVGLGGELRGELIGHGGAGQDGYAVKQRRREIPVQKNKKMDKIMMPEGHQVEQRGYWSGQCEYEEVSKFNSIICI